MAKPIARILNWVGPNHLPVPSDGICARTFTEYEKQTKQGCYWHEGKNLYLAEDLIDEYAYAVYNKLKLRKIVGEADLEKVKRILITEAQLIKQAN